MNLSEEQYELIEAYLAGDLSETDKALLESEMQADAALQAEVNRQRDIRLGLRALAIEKVLKKAQENYKTSLVTATPEPVSTPVERPLVNWRYWVAAASVVAVLGIGYYAYQQTAIKAAEVAYVESFTPDSSDELLKEFPTDASVDVRQQFLDAFTKYKAGKYDQVIDKVKTLPDDKKTVHYKNYFLGLSYLANQQPTDAIPLLQRAQASSSIQLQQKSEWFLALAYVKNQEKEKALPILKRISTDKANPFASLAERVLQKIK